MKFTVQYLPVAELGIRVEADDAETAIEKAHRMLGSFGQTQDSRSLDVDTTDLEPFRVIDADDNEVWREPTMHEELLTARRRIHDALALLGGPDSLTAAVRQALTG